MPETANASARITAYIESLPPWSQQLCAQLRQTICTSDSALAEGWKWGPHYHCHGMVCNFGAFKKHVKLTFFNGAALTDAHHLFNNGLDNAFTRSIDFTPETVPPPAVLQAYIREAIALNKEGVGRAAPAGGMLLPEALQQALAENKKAEAFFNTLSHTAKKECVTYITSAKQQKTKAARIQKIVDAAAAGKKLF